MACSAQLAAARAQSSSFSRSGRDLSICISNKFSGAADAAGLEPTVKTAVVETQHTLKPDSAGSRLCSATYLL